MNEVFTCFVLSATFEHFESYKGIRNKHLPLLLIV